MIGAIADDLTGAAEIGAVALRLGLRAEIIVSGKSGASAEVICADIDTRSCGAAEAGRRAASAAKELRWAGASWIYKKVDSVLRGQVTAEIEAMMRALRLKRALLVPANPALGRVIRDGDYFIHGRPIDETEFAFDPEHPRRSSRVIELLGRPRTVPLHLCRPTDPLPERGIVVGEAASADDLKKWAARREPGTLLSGAAGFFGALLAAEIGAGGKRRREIFRADRRSRMTAPPSASGRELFVCGTTRASAREFLAAARAKRVPVFSLPDELAWGADFTDAAVRAIASRVIASLRSHPRVILNVGLPPLRNRSAARQLAVHLVRLAATVLGRVEIEHVYAEGGATAAALAQRMGWRRLTVLRELAPGVATLAVEGDLSRQLTIKPGSYVWPTAVRRAARQERARHEFARRPPGSRADVRGSPSPVGGVRGGTAAKCETVR